MRRCITVKQLISVCGLLTLSPGCFADAVSTANVVGRYKLNQGTAQDEIEVLPDGRYVHSHRTNRGRTLADTGTWSMRNYNGNRLELAHFRFISPVDSGEMTDGADARPTLWVPVISRTLSGRVRLAVDDDIGLAYVHD